MELFTILLLITIISQAIGTIWVVVIAFQESWLDALLCLLFPYLWFYAYKHYHDKKLPTRIPAQLLILGYATPIIMLVLDDLPNYFH